MHLAQRCYSTELLVNFVCVLGCPGGLYRPCRCLAEVRSATGVEVLFAERLEIKAGRVWRVSRFRLIFVGTFEVRKRLLALQILCLEFFDFLEEQLILAENLRCLARDAFSCGSAICQKLLVGTPTVLELRHHLLYLLGLAGLRAGVCPNYVHHFARNLDQLEVAGCLARVASPLDCHSDIHVELVNTCVDSGDGI